MCRITIHLEERGKLWSERLWVLVWCFAWFPNCSTLYIVESVSRVSRSISQLLILLFDSILLVVESNRVCNKWYRYGRVHNLNNQHATFRSCFSVPARQTLRTWVRLHILSPCLSLSTCISWNGIITRSHLGRSSNFVSCNYVRCSRDVNYCSNSVTKPHGYI